MIPTTAAVTTTPTTTATATTSSTISQNSSSAMLGIASLILEGRAISDEEFIIPINPQLLNLENRSILSSGQTGSTYNIVANGYRSPIANDPTVQHVQRLREKLEQLRQSSPSTSRDYFPLGEQKISVGSSLTFEMDPLQLGDDAEDDDIYGIYGVNQQPTTCGDGFTSFSLNQRQHQHHQPEKLLCSLQSLAKTCLRTTPRAFHRNFDLPSETWFKGSRPVASSPSSSPNLSLNYFSTKSLQPQQQQQQQQSPTSNLLSSTFKMTPTSSTSSLNSSQHGPKTSGWDMNLTKNMNTVRNGTNQNYSLSKNGKDNAKPKMGPHCDQFLKKIGLFKIDAAEAEEHICDMSYYSDICYRWQQYCLEMQAITASCEPVCIEVYLGPKSHQILLEQWIIEHKDKVTTPNMTLQALCNAIHSQLHFSQTTAWCDSIRNCSNEQLLESGRVRYAQSVIEPEELRPRLDIFYRIRKYDTTASFNVKPNVHNFPNVVIAENLSISVCLKSLPRIHGGIPIVCESQEVFDSTTTIVDTVKKPLSESNGSNITVSVANGSNNSGCGPVTLHRGILETADSKIKAEDKKLELSMVDEQMPMEWIDKHGKHKCLFDDDDVSSDATTIGENSNSNGSNGSNGLDHRERQLLKYKKRIMKRDKKTKKPDEIDSMKMSTTMEMVSDENGDPNSCCQPMQLEEKFTNGINNINSSNEMIPINGQHQPLPEYGSINSIRPPLYQTVINSVAESVQTNAVEMISTGTQTANFPMIYPPCDQCNSEMAIVCFNCDNLTTDYSMDDESSSPPQKLGKAELLLQAIRRTPKAKTKNHLLNNYDFTNILGRNNRNNGDCQPTISQIRTETDCQHCKRQKTQHHYRRKEHRSDFHFNNNNNNNYKYKNINVNVNDCSSTIDCDCQLLSNESTNRKNPNNLTTTAMKNHNGSGNNLKLLLPNGKTFDKSSPSSMVMKSPTAQFKTPIMSTNISNSKPPILTKLNHHLNLISNKTFPKALPKVNLTQLFCGVGVSSSLSSSSSLSLQSKLFSSPITIIGGMPPDAFTFDNIKIGGNPEIPVQKSNSAPTLPNSPSLSPRFAKQAAIYKRRSRHLSDRSDRSSFGSDEQFSDEELDGVYSPATSPIKNRLFGKSNAYMSRPMLGNLEESLMQKRFRPKQIATGFKVLLGASGGFCPTQLTIPAVTYFYELTGQSLSTPYLSEVRLPRKGYTIPRTGTVQAAILNPEGTVVRIFVIPYDFRDMPPMHHTFIRQRILAVDNNETVDNTKCIRNLDLTTANGDNLNFHNSSNDCISKQMPLAMQMRLLRYSIHLRFQTSRSGRLALYNDIRLLISPRTDCDTAAAHAKGALEAPNELKIITIVPDMPKYSARQENPNKI